MRPGMWPLRPNQLRAVVSLSESRWRAATDTPTLVEPCSVFVMIKTRRFHYRF
jgi:hypothetical protein